MKPIIWTIILAVALSKRVFCADTTFYVENKNLTELTLSGQIDSYKFIVANNNSITVIKDNTLKGAKNLETINLNYNSISEISTRAFKDQGELKRVYLRNNQLSKLDPDVFESLTNLQELWLQDNNITVIYDGTFKHNHNLSILYLNDNEIIAVGPNAFGNMDQALNFHMNGNLCYSKNYNNARFQFIFNEIGKCRKIYNNFIEKCNSQKNEPKLITMWVVIFVESLVILSMTVLVYVKLIKPKRGEISEKDPMYAVLDLKQGGAIPMKIDDTVYAEVTTEAPVPPRYLKK